MKHFLYFLDISLKKTTGRENGQGTDWRKTVALREVNDLILGSERLGAHPRKKYLCMLLFLS